MPHIAVEQYFLAICAFFTVSLGGVALGIICGFLSCFITKHTQHVRVVEPLAVLSMAYFSYLFAELFHFSGKYQTFRHIRHWVHFNNVQIVHQFNLPIQLHQCRLIQLTPISQSNVAQSISGILSIVACGMLQWQYIRHNISKKSYYTIKYFSKTMSTASDSIIFLFFGIALLDKGNYTHLRTWHAGFVLWSVVFCLLYRVVVTGGLCLFANRYMRCDPILNEEIIIMCYVGSVWLSYGYGLNRTLVSMSLRDVIYS